MARVFAVLVSGRIFEYQYAFAAGVTQQPSNGTREQTLQHNSLLGSFRRFWAIVLRTFRGPGTVEVWQGLILQSPTGFMSVKYTLVHAGCCGIYLISGSTLQISNKGRLGWCKLGLGFVEDRFGV